MTEITKPNSRRGPTQVTGRQVWQCIHDFNTANPRRIATKTTIAQELGVHIRIIDEHVDRLFDGGDLRKPEQGAYEVTNARPNRPVSVTAVHGYGVTIEVGDGVLSGLSKQELDDVVSASVGFVRRENIKVT